MFVLRNRIFAAALLAFGAWAGDAAAVCPIDPFHVTLWVGDTASHPLCNYDTIQQAVDAVQCPNTVIVLTHEHTYTSQHITINGKPSMTLAGVDVPVACGVDPPEVIHSVRTIDGAGNGGHSVFSIINSDVTFHYLEISGGSTALGARGGGISAAGSSNITLQASLIDANSADFGGGIAAVDSGTLTIKDHVAISRNTARSNGGGVFLRDSAHMNMRGEISSIESNEATGHDGDQGYGGGVFVTNNAIADIGSPPDFNGTIGFNKARAGGGVAAVADGTDGTPAVRLFSVDPTRPVLVFANSASVHGGGIYASANASGTHVSEGSICAQDFRIDDNHSPDGAAVYGADDTDVLGVEYDAGIYFNSHDSIPGDPCNRDVLAAAAIGEPLCSTGLAVPCNEVSRNNAVTASGDPSGGAIIKGTSLDLNRMDMRDNDGGQMIFGYDKTYITLTNSLIADNRSQHEIVHAEHDSTITNVTIVNNRIDSGFVFFLKHFVDFQNDLVWQPGRSTIDYLPDGCSDCFNASNALVSENASFPQEHEVIGMPSLDAFGFIDAGDAIVGNRDYHLGAWVLNGISIFSPALDVAAAGGGDIRDLDNLPRNQDLPIIDNGAGVRDLGCYEVQSSQFISDRIFAESFGDRVSLLR